jgi:tetratricopeptide (TPR) repeat protein
VQAKQYNDAVIILRRLLQVVPDNSTARANLATALFQIKKFEEAKIEYRWLTEKQPTLPIAYYFLAIIHDNLAEYMDAMANYQQFLKLADSGVSKLEIEKVNLRLPALQKLIKQGKGKKDK